jgi:hypothetical protein
MNLGGLTPANRTACGAEGVGAAGWAVAWVLLLASPLWREVRTFRDEQFTNVKEIGEALGALPEHGVIVTSEAFFCRTTRAGRPTMRGG